MLAALLGVVVALTLGEALVRVARPGYAERRAEYAIRPVSEEPPSWVYEPGSKVVFTWDGDPIGVLPGGARMEIAINGAGLRGPLPAPGAGSVVVLGDSFTFGEGVELADTFVERLAARPDIGAPFVNAGVAGHGTIEEAARLDAMLTHFRPRAVLLVFVPNDAIPWQDSAARGADLLNAPALGGSRLVQFVRTLASRGDAERWYLSYYTGDRKEHWAAAREALVWMGRTCASRGVRFGVAAFPLMHRLHDYPFTAITELVREAAKDAGAQFVDLTPAFAGRYDERELWVHPADRHPNARAHAIAAEAMAPLVRQLLR